MKYLKTIGFNSNQPIGRGFNYPYDTAFSADGRIFVMNRMGGPNPRGIRIQICTFDEDWLGEFSTGPGDGDDQFRVPVCMAFDAHDNLYVTDEVLNEVKVFDSQGSFLRKWGTEIDGVGSLAGPAGVAHGAGDSVFIVEQYANRVRKLTPNGESIMTWGESGDGPGQFNLPWGATTDSDGNVYIADWRNDRVQKFDPTGTFLNEWGQPGDDEGQFHRPAGTAVDSDGVIYVADWGNERVQVLSPDGRVLAVLRGASEEPQWATDYFLANPDEAAARRQANLEPVLDPPAESNREESANIEKLLWGPTAVKVDNQGRIYIVDSCRHRLQIYSNPG
jgi:DNA-binding beta-propeller fold protein YncE